MPDAGTEFRLYGRMDILELLDTGYDWVGLRIAEVAPADLDSSTPCEKWDLRQLLNHQIGVVSMIADRVIAAEPATAAELGLLAEQVASADIIGTDPAAAYAATVDRARAAWRIPGVFDRTCVMPMGEIPVRVAATVALTDVVTHGWDTARALGSRAHLSDRTATAGAARRPRYSVRARCKARSAT